MRFQPLILTAVPCLVIVSTAGAWGGKGHEVVGLIAERELSDDGRAAVAAILGEGVSLADVATWADEIRNRRRETAPWHYLNPPPADDAPLETDDPAAPVSTRPAIFVADRDCPGGNCVVGAIERFQRELADTSLPLERRREALKFLVHFVGDVHQPLHVGRGADRGGNDIRISWQGLPANLHETWDTLLIERERIIARQYAEELLYELTPGEREAWSGGSPADWAEESWHLANTSAYRLPDGTPVVSGMRLGRRYAQAAAPVIDRRLTQAGLRLARLIREALGGDADTTTAPAPSTPPPSPEHNAGTRK